MSTENVKRFYEALAKDPGLQAKFKTIEEKYEGQKLREAQINNIYRDEVLPAAGESGFDFTLDELKEYAEQAKKPATHELSEQELAAVAGGDSLPPSLCLPVGITGINVFY